MNKICLIFSLWLMSFTASAQTFSSKSSLAEKFFERLAVSKTDTLYAVRHNWKFSIKPKISTSFGAFNFR